MALRPSSDLSRNLASMVIAVRFNSAIKRARILWDSDENLIFHALKCRRCEHFAIGDATRCSIPYSVISFDEILSTSSSGEFYGALLR